MSDSAPDVSDRALVESSRLPMWIHDRASGRFLAVNDAAVRLYGWSRDELLSSTVDRVAVDRTTRERLFKPTPLAVFAEGGTHRRSDGTLMQTQISVEETEFAYRPAYLVMAMDVSDGYRAEERLRKSERQLADAQELAHVGSFEWEIDTNEVTWSDELFRIYGLKPRQFEATYEAFLERVHPDDRKKIDDTIRRTVQTGEPFQMEERIVRPDGTIRVLESRGRLVTEKRLIGVCRDVTDLRAAEHEREEHARREHEARRSAEAAHAEVREILERVTDAFVALDRNWRYIYVNQRAAEIFGRDRDSLIGKHIWTEFPEGVGQPFHVAYEKAMATQQPITIEEYYLPWDKWLENRIYPSPNGLAIYFQDVTERRRKEDELREANERLVRTEQFSLVMVAHISADGHWLKLPTMLANLLGYSEEELAAKDVESIIHPDDLQDDRMHRDRIIRGESRSEDIEMRLVRKDGGIVWVYLNCSGVYDADGQLTHFIVYLRDITERHRAEERIRHQALHDDLTGLPNRVLFNDRLGQAIGHAHRHDRMLAVLTADLDNFKLVNDNFGHSFGDIVIRDVSGRLKTALRSTDTIARLGSDEFAIIVEDIVDEEQATTIADKVREAIADPFEIGGHSAGLTISIGISLFPRDGRDAEMLFRSSASALHRAKEIGTDNVQLFDETMSGRFRDRLIMEHELRTAVQEQRLLPYYQPILRSSDEKIVAVEALIRWDHPQRGIVGPDNFIPLAEETRLIVPIGEFALRSACRDIKNLIDTGIDMRLSVNLSARQFQEMNLVHTIDGILAETRFAPSNLELEVTESVAMQNADFTMDLLRDLRRRDISIAIDDFGAGQTSLIYLRQFPINNIKIDKVFISDMLTDATDAAIVRTVILLAHTLGLTTTAEGVETREQMEMLRGFGCDLLQGYYISPPLPSGELVQFLRTH